MLWWLLSNFSFVKIEAGDVSVVGISGYHRLLVERLSSDSEAILHGDILVFAAITRENRQIFRVSRVVAVPGDRVERTNGCYSINGEPTDTPVSEEVRLEGLVPDGFYILVNDNPLSTYSDSLRLGLIDQRFIVGRYLTEMPF
jgi:signal peptidase I